MPATACVRPRPTEFEDSPKQEWTFLQSVLILVLLPHLLKFHLLTQMPFLRYHFYNVQLLLREMQRVVTARPEFVNPQQAQNYAGFAALQ